MQLQAKARELLQQGRVNMFLGFERGTQPLRNRLCVITDAGAVGGLVWDSMCQANLAVYLPQYFVPRMNLKKGEVQTFPKVGIAVKGCDLRAVMLLAREHQILRDQVITVGIPCRGMLDPARLQALAGTREVAGVAENGDSITVTTAAGPVTGPRESLLADACRECRYPVPRDADLVLEGGGRAPAAERYARVWEFERRSPAERWAYFRKELSACIRCNACRQACPTCYCKECFADQTRPRWVGIGNGIEDVMFFHIGRILHQAGRCVECDACSRACPMGIDLRTFTSVMGRDIEALYGYAPGTSMQEVQPLLAYDIDEDQGYTTEPRDRQD
ncbi:MAG: Coenzyme F420 hydrogenase/dehydrogenase, beta subunit C-terminal domain [Planctomycetota bacterium]